MGSLFHPWGLFLGHCTIGCSEVLTIFHYSTFHHITRVWLFSHVGLPLWCSHPMRICCFSCTTYNCHFHVLHKTAISIYYLKPPFTCTTYNRPFHILLTTAIYMYNLQLQFSCTTYYCHFHILLIFGRFAYTLAIIMDEMS